MRRMNESILGWYGPKERVVDDRLVKRKYSSAAEGTVYEGEADRGCDG